MKLFITYIVFLSLTLQSFYRTIMTVEYQIHIKEYMENCINKARPALHCDGQCILMKKIQDKEEKETQKNLASYEFNGIYLHQEQIFYTVIPSEEKNTNFYYPYLMGHPSKHHTSIFRPPIFESVLGRFA